MKLVEGVHVEWVDHEAVILDPRTEQLHYLNETAALFYALIVELGYGPALSEMRRRFSSVEDLDAELERITSIMLEGGLIEDV